MGRLANDISEGSQPLVFARRTFAFPKSCAKSFILIPKLLTAKMKPLSYGRSKTKKQVSRVMR